MLNYEIVKSVEGWLTKKESEKLFELAKLCPENGEIVEIGSYKGKSTICLALGTSFGSGAHINAIDPFIQSAEGEFRKNLENADVKGKVKLIPTTSEEAVKTWNGKISFLFIDGNHEYDYVKKDMELWSPFLVSGGIIAFHDSTSSPQDKLMGYMGPKKVVDEFIFRSKDFSNFGVTDTITYAVKRPPLNVYQRFSDIAVIGRKKTTDFLLISYTLLFPKIPKPIQDLCRKIIYGKS